MVNIQPFQAISYNSEKVGDLNLVITPPSDSISPEQQAQFFHQNPFNFLHLDLAKSLHSHQAAGETLNEWLVQDILVKESETAFYFYRQDFTYLNQRLFRMNLFALCEIADYEEQLILPHERIMEEAKQDLLGLMRATQANLSPIWMLYADPEHQLLESYSSFLAETSPICQYQDDNDIQHTIWPYRDPEGIKAIHRWFAGKQLFIADGHHRYDAALTYHQETNSVSNQFVMICLTNSFDPNHLVLPTHRLINTQISKGDFLAKASQYFTVELIDEGMISDCLSKAPESFCYLVLQFLEGTYLLKREKQLPRGIQENRSSAYRLLDMAIFHELILKEILNFSDVSLKEQRDMLYSPHMTEIQEWLNMEKGNMAVFFNSTSIQELCDVSLANDIMPPKSTYFYPKLPSGLVIHCFDKATS